MDVAPTGTEPEPKRRRPVAASARPLVSVLAESGSAEGPDGLHGVGEQGLLEVVVGGVGRVGAARGPGLDVYAHPGHIRSEPDDWRGLGRLWEEVDFRRHRPVSSRC